MDINIEASFENNEYCFIWGVEAVRMRFTECFEHWEIAKQAQQDLNEIEQMLGCPIVRYATGTPYYNDSDILQRIEMAYRDWIKYRQNAK